MVQQLDGTPFDPRSTLVVVHPRDLWMAFVSHHAHIVYTDARGWWGLIEERNGHNIGSTDYKGFEDLEEAREWRIGFREELEEYLAEPYE